MMPETAILLLVSGGRNIERKEAIRSAYRLTGGNNFYDGTITCSTLSGKAVCRLVWDMNQAECDAYLEKAKRLHLKNVTFRQGDVGVLSYADDIFDIVLSLNGFHAFPDKVAAYREIFRVLRPGGTFCGCFYVADEHKRTDWFVRHIYEKAGFFTPPYETVSSLKKRLEHMYTAVTLENVKGIAWFVCRKEAKTETENEERKETKA